MTYTDTTPRRTIVHRDQEVPGRGWKTEQVQQADGTWWNVSVTRVAL